MDRLHEAIDLRPERQRQLAAAAKTVFDNRRRGQVAASLQLEKRIEELKTKKSNLVGSIADPANASFKDELRPQVEDTARQLEGANIELTSLRDSQPDILDFVHFSLDYLAHLKDHFWELTHEEQVWYEGMLFPDGFFINLPRKFTPPK